MHDFTWFQNYISHVSNVIYVFIFFKYHEICFENVLVKCYVHNKYVFLDMYVYKQLRWLSDHEGMGTVQGSSV